MQGVKEMVLNTQRANKSKVKQNIDVVLRNGISNMIEYLIYWKTINKQNRYI